MPNTDDLMNPSEATLARAAGTRGGPAARTGQRLRRSRCGAARGPNRWNRISLGLARDMLTGVLAGALIPGLAFAGNVLDSDLDLVPDAFDNCLLLANGPGESCNQVDVDLDGYGNSCDVDVDQDFVTTTLDFSRFLSEFTSLPEFPTMDLDCDGSVTTLDFAIFLAALQSGQGPGPSGLPCAGTVPCVP